MRTSNPLKDSKSAFEKSFNSSSKYRNAYLYTFLGKSKQHRAHRLRGEKLGRWGKGSGWDVLLSKINLFQ